MDDLHEGHELVVCERWEVLKELTVKTLFLNKDGETVAAIDPHGKEELLDDTCIDSYVYCYTCDSRVAHDDVV